MACSAVAVKKCVVHVSVEEREQHEDMIRAGKHAADRLMWARILLKADVSPSGEGWSDSRIAEALDVSTPLAHNVRKRLCEEGFRRRLDAQAAGGSPGRADVRRRRGGQAGRPVLLQGAGGLRELDVASAFGKSGGAWDRRSRQRQYDRSGIKKALKPHLSERWVIPPDANAGFVAAMEDVLDVYKHPRRRSSAGLPGRDPKAAVQGDTRPDRHEERPAGAARRLDCEYERNGTADLFTMFAPLEGWRHVKMTNRYTAIDYARV